MNDFSGKNSSLVIGGPFCRLQQKLGLLSPDLLPTPTTALLFSLLAWGPLAALSMMEGRAFNPGLEGGAFFYDFSAYARFIIAVFTLTVMEPIAEQRIRMMMGQFLTGRLISDDEKSVFLEAYELADKRTSSNLVEGFLLLLAFIATVNAVDNYLAITGGTWFGSLIDGHIKITLAGWWAMLISLPFVWFLILRWCYRFFIWTLLLRDISKLNLRLVATHPDLSGGIGFLGLFPPTFSLMVFSLSTMAASVVLQDVIFSNMSLEWVGAMYAVSLIFILAIFVGPLGVFYRNLYDLKMKALLDYGTLATIHNRLFEEKWVHPHDTDDVIGTPDISSLADLGGGYEAIRSMGFIPVSSQTFKPLIFAMSIPWLAVVLTQVPLAMLLSTIASALL